MRNLIDGLLLFALQLYFTFNGSAVLGKYGNPVLLFAISMAIPGLYFYLHLQHKNAEKTGVAPRGFMPWLWALAGLVVMSLSYEEMRKLLLEFANPRDYSDVIPQIEMLFTRFKTGVFPYAPVDMGNYQPYPVYMPLHWLPVGLGQAFGLDSRWVGYLFLALASGLFGYAVAIRSGRWSFKLVAITLPALALWAFILWGGMEIPVSYELLIAAYYLLLASGLMLRNPWLIGAGLITTLLSRYTLVFWIPLFALLMWHYAPKKLSYFTWGAVAIAFIALYFIPFLLHDPTILSKGIAYHNQAAIDEWNGYGDPPVSWSFERGIYFAPHLKALFSGEMAHRVTLARILQGSLMLTLCFGGYFVFQKWLKGKMPWHAFSLGMLYTIIAGFYFFGPLTYRYYFIVLFMLSAALCAEIILFRGERRVERGELREES